MAGLGARLERPFEHVHGLLQQPGPGFVMGDVQGCLGTTRQGGSIAFEERLFVPGPHVERVGGKGPGDHLAGLRQTAGTAQERRLEPERQRLGGIRRERPFEECQGLVGPAFDSGDLGAGRVGGRTVGAIPDGLAEGRVGLLQAPGQAQGQAQQVAGFAIARVAVAHREPLECRSQVAFGIGVLDHAAGTTRPWPCCSGCRLGPGAAPRGSSPPAAGWRGGTAAGACP